jgi:hypothetical protein
LHREVRAFSAGDLRTDPRGDCQSDFPADSHRDSQADLRHDLRRDLQRDFRGDFDRDLRLEGQGAAFGSSDQSAVFNGGRRAMGRSRLAVDVATVSDVEDEDGPSRVVYLVDNAVVTDPNPPAAAADQFAAALRPWVTG